jgi:hypothetical protein
MTMTTTLRLCVYGTAGSGKSTVSRLIAEELTARGLSTQIVKIALPLYRLQQHLYATAGRDVDLWTHDNELLRLLATQLRRINPHFLAEDFLDRVQASPADVVINDDLRDTGVDYPRLTAAGFQFVRVSCDDDVRGKRLAARGDVSVVPDSDHGWGFHRIRPDWVLDNSTDESRLRECVRTVVDQYLAAARVGS